jgi:hypothetical protein
VRSDGAIEMTDERPTSPVGLMELRVRRQCDAGPGYVFIGCYEWRRLWWNDGKWTVSHAAFSTFRRDVNIARGITRLACRGYGAADSNMSAHSGQLRSRKVSAEKRERHEAGIRKEADKVAKSWGGANLLYELHIIDAAIDRASAPNEKIRLSKERRGLLASLVSRYPSD